MGLRGTSRNIRVIGVELAMESAVRGGLAATSAVGAALIRLRTLGQMRTGPKWKRKTVDETMRSY